MRSEAPHPKGRGFCLSAVLRARARIFYQFHIAPLDPALKGGACGEQTGQKKVPMQYSEQKRILVIEDDIHIAEGLKLNLALQGYDVMIAQDGVYGLQQWKKWQPDLIVLDIMLPGIDGFKLLKILKDNKDTKEIPIIMVSAKDQREDIDLAYKLGAEDYVIKPIGANKLYNRVEQLVSKLYS